MVTPDPASVTAKLAGKRWWGYLPAHTVLLPRRTLRELLSAAGLVISDDVPFVRTFAAKRWVGGLAERLPAGERLSALADRLPPVKLSLSLGDERVILAHRTPVTLAEQPLLTHSNGRAPVHVVLPAYRAVRTIPDVVAEMPSGAADSALLIDDASPDETTNVALLHGLDVLRHPSNRGYGASQKTGYTRALRDGAAVIVMVHADNQYDPGLVADMAEPILAGDADVVIGSRLLVDRAVAGGMPRWKWVGNRLLTGIENAVFGVRFSEYHTGYRAFSADFLRSIPFLRNSDDFVFDQEIFAQVLARNATVVEIPIPTRYFHEASSVDLVTSLRYAFKTLWMLGRFKLTAAGRSCADPPHGFQHATTSHSDPAGRAGHPRRVGARDAGLPARARRTRLQPPRDLDRQRGRVRLELRPRDRVPAARVPDLPRRRLLDLRAVAGVGAAGERAGGHGDRRADRRDLRARCGSSRIALIAMALAAVYIPLILVGQSVMSEPLFVLCLLGAIACALRGLGARRGAC